MRVTNRLLLTAQIKRVQTTWSSRSRWLGTKRTIRSSLFRLSTANLSNRLTFSCWTSRHSSCRRRPSNSRISQALHPMGKAVLIVMKKIRRKVTSLLTCRVLRLNNITRDRISIQTCSRSSRDAWSNLCMPRGRRLGSAKKTKSRSVNNFCATRP